MKQSRPAVRPSIRIALLEDGYLLLDSLHDRIHFLNPAAALIFELCNGRRTVATIVEMVVQACGEAGMGPAAIEQWLADAGDSGLISFDSPSPSDPREINSDELHDLAWRLRERGETAQAFACQKRAAELSPDDPGTWFSLGELAQIEGDRDTALAAYRRYLQIVPDDPEVAHIVVALSDGPPPPRAPRDSVVNLYRRFSRFYDKNMLNELDYRAPELTIAALKKVLRGDPSDLAVLDLGCGTGLAGTLLRPWARRLDGLDISSEMAALARKRGCYDLVEVSELTAWLKETDRRYDLVTACDVLVYFGDLAAVFSGVSRILEPDGLFGFTLERGISKGITLLDSGRFAHSGDHLENAARQAGLEAACLENDVLRTEYDEPVTGIVAVLRRMG